MRKAIFTFYLPLVIAALLFYGLFVTFFPTRVLAAPVPILKINQPTDGQIIESYIVNVDFSLKNFTLKDYHTALQNNPNQGHLLIWLDQDELKPDKAVIYYKGSPYAIADVLPGKHTLVVELTNNDGTVFDPPILQTIKFETRAPAGSEAAPLKPGDQPKVAETKTAAVPTLTPKLTWPSYLTFLVIGVLLIILGLLGIAYLKRTNPPTPIV